MKKKLVVLMFLLLASLLTACGGGTSQSGVTATPTLPSTGTVRAQISGLGRLNFSEEEYGIAADDRTVWVHNGNAGTLLRIDPGTNAIVATIPVGFGQGGVAIGQRAVWVANSASGTLTRIDPQTNHVVATVTLASPDDPFNITVSPGAVWVTDFANNSLIRIDPQTNKVVATIPHQAGPTAVSFGSGSVWVCNHHDPTRGLTRLDPQANQVQAQIDVGNNLNSSCMSVVALPQTVWTMSFINGDPQSAVLKRIDPATNMISAATQVPGVLPHLLAADEQGGWVINPEAGLFRIDPHTNRMVLELAITGGDGVALGAGSVWVADASTGTLLRITPAP